MIQCDVSGLLLHRRDCPETELHERRKYLEWIEQEAVPGDDGLVRESEWVKKDVKALTAPWKEWEQEMVDADTVRDTCSIGLRSGEYGGREIMVAASLMSYLLRKSHGLSPIIIPVTTTAVKCPLTRFCPTLSQSFRSSYL